MTDMMNFPERWEDFLHDYEKDANARDTISHRWTEVPKMADCKWCQDEICVNADCPMCADYCPVPDAEGVCRFEERGAE